MTAFCKVVLEMRNFVIITYHMRAAPAQPQSRGVAIQPGKSLVVQFQCIMPCIVTGAVCRRSLMAAYELTNLGFKNGVRVLKGGFNEWRKSGRCGRGVRHVHARRDSGCCVKLCAKLCVHQYMRMCVWRCCRKVVMREDEEENDENEEP